MHLTRSEERALAGEFGEPLQIAYRVLLALARLTDAKSFVPIEWAHVSGVSYLTIGRYGLDFLREISSSQAKFKVFTTVNPCGMDIEKWNEVGIPVDYAQNQLKIISCYQKLGTASSFTCVPFQSYPVPSVKSHIAWAESSAAIYANSVLGLRTNRESAVSALAAALTGKTVYSDLHISENRQPTVAVKVTCDKLLTKKPPRALAFGVLGYYAGKNTSGVVELQGLATGHHVAEQKSLCAALGTVGSTGMYTLGRTKGLETIEFGNREYSETLGEISDSEQGELIVFGCPQMTVEELYELSKSVRGRHFRKKCIIFCSSRVYQIAKERGYIEIIEAAGGTFVRDACADFTPLISALGVGSVVTDSVKGAHYMKRVHGVRTSVNETRKIIFAYS